MKQLLLRLYLHGDDARNPAVRARCGKLAGLTGIVCNAVLCAAKLAVGMLSGSVSITADAVNNLSDAASSVVTLLGFRLAEKPADEDHPYGHARMEYIAGLAVAALILVISVQLARSSIDKILHPEPVEFSAVLAAVLLGSILIKLWMALLNRTLGRAIDSETLKAAAADSRNDVISTAVVLICCTIGHFSSLMIDGYAGLAVAIFIVVSGIGIAKDTVDPLLGAAPDREMMRRVADEILQYDGVLGIHDLMVHDYGPGRRFASVHVEMDASADPLVCHDLIDDIERDFRTHHHIDLVIHYDPVVTDDAELNEMRETVQQLCTQLDPRLSIHDFRMVRGPGHSNLIFDLVVPFDLQPQREQLGKILDERIRAAHPQYYTVITFDEDAFNLRQDGDSHGRTRDSD